MPAPCRSLPPTALEYFASLVADDASLSLLEAAIVDRPGRLPASSTCQAVLAEIDALAARLKRAHRRPTPRRCSGCAC